MYNNSKQTFNLQNKSGSSGDYIKNKKSKLMYCNRSGYCNNKGVSSYSEKNLIENGKMIEEPIEAITYELNSSLLTQLDYDNVKTYVDLDGNRTAIDLGFAVGNAIPLYSLYKIDPDGSMFGKTVCAENNLLNYRVAYEPVPTQVVYKN